MIVIIFPSWAWFGMSYTRHTNILHVKTWISRLMLQIKSCARNMKCEKEKDAALETQSSLFFDLLCGSFLTFWWDSFWGILSELFPTVGRSNAHPLNLDIYTLEMICNGGGPLQPPPQNLEARSFIRMARTSSAAPPCPTSTGCPQGQSEHGQSVLIHLTDVQATMLQGIVDWFFVTGSVELNEAITANFRENLCPYHRKRCL